MFKWLMGDGEDETVYDGPTLTEIQRYLFLNTEDETRLLLHPNQSLRDSVCLTSMRDHGDYELYYRAFVISEELYEMLSEGKTYITGRYTTCADVKPVWLIPFGKCSIFALAEYIYARYRNYKLKCSECGRFESGSILGRR